MTDFETGVMVGMLLSPKAGTTKNGDDIYIVDYSPSLVAVYTIENRNGDSHKITSYSFSFTFKEFKIVTEMSTSRGKSTRTWQITIITSVVNDEGLTIWTLEPDETGKIISIYDSNDNEILKSVTNGESVITETPAGIALGYALAYNKEQESYIEELIDAYKKGIDDDEDIGVDGEDANVDVTDLKGNGAAFKNIYRGKTYTVYGEYGILHNTNSDGTYNVTIWSHYGVDGIYSDELIPTTCKNAIAMYGDWLDKNNNPIETDGITYT